MKTLMNNAAKGMAGLVFVVLLAVNVQIGSGNSLLGTSNATISQAKADCPESRKICGWGEFPDGTVVYMWGEPLVVEE